MTKTAITAEEFARPCRSRHRGPSSLARGPLRHPRLRVRLRTGPQLAPTHPFDEFFSPPHLFIYSTHLCATITLAYIAFTPDLRRWFGDAFALPLLPFAAPCPIALAEVCHDWRGRLRAPFMNNISPEVLRLIAAIPVLAAEPAFQHTTRIYLANDITPFSPLFVPLIVPALVIALGGTAAIGWRWWALTGICFGTATAITWDRPFSLGGPLVAGPLLAAGAAFADRIWRVVERPTRRGVLTLVTVAGIGTPALTGVIDLILRGRTP